MLSIGKMGSGQERYYLGKVAEGAEDYYSGEGEAEGYWLGDAAEDLDLQGKIDPDQLIGMLTGQNPATGEPLGLRHVEGGPVPGFDLTFSAPKSVSLTWALGGHPSRPRSRRPPVPQGQRLPRRDLCFDVYGHLLPGSYDDVRARMDAYLAKDATREPVAAPERAH